MGKTNALDAIFYLSNLKSNSVSRDIELVRQGADFFRVEASVEMGENTHSIQIGLDKHRKLTSMDDEKIEKRLDWIGRIPVWMISPEDDEIVKEGSAVRRKMMNHLLGVLDRSYLEDLIAYNRLLKQRNTYLKTTAPRGVDRHFLMTYSEQMNDFALRVAAKRKKVSEEILPHFDETYKAISKTEEKAELFYSSSLKDNNLVDLHQANIDKDIVLKRTCLGPHRDDWVFNLAGKRLKYFGSQGQKKTFILSVKLSLIQLYYERTKKRPILLLDDVFDKIDVYRAQGLIEWLSNSCIHQIIITDTERERSGLIFDRMKLEYKHYQVENGSLVYE